MLRAPHTPHGVQAVGLRQETLPQCFLIASTASRVFQQHPNIRAYPRHPRKNISAISGQKSDPNCSRLSVFICGFPLHESSAPA
jgi:hypothetical protein